MAVTITTDLVVRHANDAITNTAGIGGINAPTGTDTTIFVEGTGSNFCRSNGLGVGGTACLFTNTDLTGLHVFGWVNHLDKADTKANGGWRLRISANGAQTSNFGEWTCGGNDTQASFNKGYYRFCADVGRPFDFSTGTPAALSGVGMIATVVNQLTSTSRDTWFIDSQDTATFLRIAGGGVGTEGQASEIASDDITNGRGMFQSVQNAYYILGKLIFGPSSAVASEFLDSNQVYIFQDQPVSATFHFLEFVGGSAVTNQAIFGTKSGTGVATEASSGNTFKAVGESPFSVKAVDSLINVGFYGCNFINPATAMSDTPRAVQWSPATPSYTDVTRDAGDAGANDFIWMPVSEAVNDFGVVGHNELFSSLSINVGTAGIGGVVVWEYWNGTAWTALTDVTDGTNSFTTAGINSVTFSIPGDWATQTLGGLGPHYHIRHKVTTVFSTNPNFTQIKCVMGGGVRLEASSVEAIRCVFTNMDTIRVRNGAFLKKSIITNSVAPAKSASLDLGSADPAADTVRDLTIQNCSKGILLKGTGNVTYSFRNIKFSNNTKDVRVDFPAGSTVTINISEGGSTPTIDNVNGSTVDVQNPVTTLIHVTDNNGTNLQNARVYLEASDNTGGLPFQESVNSITRVTNTTVAKVTHTAHGLVTNDFVNLSGITDKTEDNSGAHQVTVIDANNYEYTTTDSGSISYNGIITATGALLYGVTDINGDISVARTFTSNQPVKGSVRKSSIAPRFKTFDLAGNTISSSTGFTINVRMISDE